MHVRRLLSRWLEQHEVIGHAMRAMALVRVVQALVMGGKAALTQMGRNRAGEAHVKHHIKAVDRLLGNRHLHREWVSVHKAIAQTLLAKVQRPVLTVDWSDFECGGSRKWAMIQASVPVGGRAVVIYARAFPFKRYNSPGAHREFLLGLKAVLPSNCRPILITDAGFRERRIKQLYATRMQIEETFRDTKSHRFGFGLRYTRSSSLHRIQVLLLLVALATLVLWLVGLAAGAHNLARRFQANTISHRAVLSTPFLGRQLLLTRSLELPVSAFDQALERLCSLIRLASLA